MLHILGMILKIAGILLGSILGMILLISLLVLFVPIRYRAEGRYEEKPEADAVVSWLLSAFRLRVRYGETGVTIKIRILGIPLGGRKKPAARDTEEKPEKKTKEEPDGKQNAVPEEEDRKREVVQKEEQRQKVAAPETGGEESLPDRPGDRGISDTEDTWEETEEKKRKVTLSERIRGIKDKIKYTFQKICDKIKNIREKKRALQEFMKDERNKEALRLIIRQLKYLWRKIRPGKLVISCHFGFDDPALTGQALAAASVLYPFYRDNIRLYPDFEKKTLSGEFYLKGRIRIFPMLLIIIRLWRNRQIRGTVRKFLNRRM